MWNISSYIYDINNLSNFFYKINSSNIDDYMRLNRNQSIIKVDNELLNNIMKIYNNYLYMSLGLEFQKAEGECMKFIFTQTYFLNYLISKLGVKYFFCIFFFNSSFNIFHFHRTFYKYGCLIH